MPLLFDPNQLSRLVDAARHLNERARLQQRQLETLVAAAENDITAGLAALHADFESERARITQLEDAIEAQLRRSEESIQRARQLCVGAREDQLATRRLNAVLGEAQPLADVELAGRTRPAVLVVDDYDDARELLSLLLYEAGFMVRTASNGLEALIAAYEMRPAVIVMDVTMPVLDGVEATRLIKAIDEIRDARVIAHTARSLQASAARGLFAAVLHKPAHPSELIAMVQHCIATT